jgi:hypothetical protein
VETAGAESFETAFSGAHLEDAGEDETVKTEDDKTGHNDVFTPTMKTPSSLTYVLLQESWNKGGTSQK